MVFETVPLKEPRVDVTIWALATLLHHHFGIHKLQQTDSGKLLNNWHLHLNKTPL